MELWNKWKDSIVINYTAAVFENVERIQMALEWAERLVTARRAKEL